MARGKTIAGWSAGLAATALVGGAVLARPRLVEAWHISKLQAADEAEAFRAAEALGRLGSTRAVPHLLALVARPGGDADSGAGSPQYTHDLGDLLDGDREEVLYPVNVGSRTEHLVRLLAEATGDPESLSWASDHVTVLPFREVKPGLDQTLVRIRKVCAVLDAIGGQCLPEVERAASRVSLPCAVRAFAEFYLCRRGSPNLCLPDEGAEFSVSRTVPAAIRGSPQDLFLSISDGTPDQVRVQVKLESGGVLLDGPLGEGGTATLAVGSRFYLLRLKDLWTDLIDGRWAIFHLAEEPKE